MKKQYIKKKYKSEIFDIKYIINRFGFIKTIISIKSIGGKYIERRISKYSIIKENKIKKGDVVLFEYKVKKEITNPSISIVENLTQNNHISFIELKICPFCIKELELNFDGRLRCLNNECYGIILERFILSFKDNFIGFKTLFEKTMFKLVFIKGIQSYSEILSLSFKDIRPFINSKERCENFCNRIKLFDQQSFIFYLNMIKIYGLFYSDLLKINEKFDCFNILLKIGLKECREIIGKKRDGLSLWNFITDSITKKMLKGLDKHIRTKND